MKNDSIQVNVAKQIANVGLRLFFDLVLCQDPCQGVMTRVFVGKV
jgi:hypothetical protein